METQEILDLIRNSSFSRAAAHKSDIHFKRFIKGLLQYTNNGDDENLEDIFKAVPAFQRDNDKWTLAMKQSFIKNVIMGYRTTVLLYEIESSESRWNLLNECKIIDGLQRISAIYEFMTGEFTVFGKDYDALVRENILHVSAAPIGIKIYIFKSEKEAIEFYISINENISHSKDDIDRARQVLASL
ncbi:MAG: DUF262 domain-containing protein [Pseudomonadota bacterium]|nr:DUF262 domain-containing protein [Pseudomonadota bacterium]